MARAAQKRLLHDAVVVVPGIMGSELVDTANDTKLWGRPTSSATRPGCSSTGSGHWP